MIYMRSSGLLISVDRNGFKGEKIKKKGNNRTKCISEFTAIAIRNEQLQENKLNTTET